MKTIEVKSSGQISSASKELLSLSNSKRVFAFYGEMGAGKTTFIKAICEELGVKDGMSSPTFSVINEYHTSSGEKIFHFDFYRIKSESEVFDMGYEEYFYSGNYCFIEWPEKIEHLLPENCVRVKIEVVGNERKIFVTE